MNPNGMSFFLASVPKGTLFYHGTGQSEPIRQLEWLAFTPEHSLKFAHRNGGRFHPHPKEQASSGFPDGAQHLLGGEQDEKSQEVDEHGYLHTYAAAKDLRLLYIDGISAGPGGGTESQDRILFNDTIDGWRLMSGPSLGGPPSEQQRALEACRMANEEWGGRIDGVVRTEGDFEIILCSFERDLEVVQITQTKPQDGFPGPGRGRPGPPGGGGGHRGPQWRGEFWSLASRFDEVLGRKVRLEFDHFVSAYTYDLDLFPNNATHPQLRHIPIEQLHPIRKDVIKLVNTRETSLHAFDWQSVADMIVFRYAEELQILAAGNFSSIKSLRDRVEQLLEPFIDYRDSGAREVIVDRCQTEFIPITAPTDSLGGSVIRSISRSICSTFTSVLMDEMDMEAAVTRFQELVLYLRWTVREKE